MTVSWTTRALSDLARLHEFLSSVDPAAATKVIQQLVQVPESLAEHPRIGERLHEFDPREVRRLLVATYEIRYELSTDAIHVLRIWHTRENR